MTSPIAVTDYIHFDALIWHAVLEELLGSAFWNQTGEENYDIHLPLKTAIQTNIHPTLKHRRTGEAMTTTKKYYHSSVGFYDKGFVEGVTAWRKRVDMPAGMGKVDIKRGYFKAFDMPLTYVSTPTVTFYANGNRDEISRLLAAHISHIGKKRSQGYGKIKTINIETIDEDKSILADGKLQRPIPVKGCPYKFANPIEAYYAYHPPYWRTANLTQCYMPNSIILIS